MSKNKQTVNKIYNDEIVDECKGIYIKGMIKVGRNDAFRVNGDIKTSMREMRRKFGIPLQELE